MNRIMQQRLRRKVRTIVESLLNEEEDGWSSSDTKIADKMVQALSAVPYPHHSTNDRTIMKFYDDISTLRIQLMDYIEGKTGKSYQGVAGNGSKWKLR